MKKVVSVIFLFSVLFPFLGSAQTLNGEPFAHTFSIVAWDEKTGEMGVAVQSHWFSVGSIVSWAEAGVGAIATQSLVNVSFGPKGLNLLKEGKSAEQVLKALISSDEGRDFRQLAVVDATGRVAVHTGKKCIQAAGYKKGKSYSVQANMMLNEKVWPRMSRAFESAKGPLAERMLAALKAGQAAGGDIRGQQSAAVLVVRVKPTGNAWEDRIIDLRVEDHPRAVEELDRVLRVYRAYEHMNRGDVAIEKGDEKKALTEYGAAQALFPDNIEMKFWHAVSLVNMKRVEEALPIFKKVFQADENWRELTRRIVKNGLLSVDKKTLSAILSAHKGDSKK